MNRLEKRVQELKDAVEKKPCPYNQFEEAMIHASIIKKENCLYMWNSFQQIALTPGSTPEEQRTCKSWNGFKRDTKLSEVYQWFTDSFKVNVQQDLVEQI